ncbi:hypothetical protein DV495_004734 [Geotrichum candidum]|nr:hypothetical protein DV495_004734 [Geotrichum candidum]KAI8135079.1 hypothetical protein DUD61_001308 [Geotrichum candidum]
MARLILNPKKPGDRAIKGVIFDMDGTLCKPQMRDALGIDKSIDILDYVHSLPDNGPQQEAQLKLQAIERNAMVNMEAQPGMYACLSWQYLDC